MTALWFMNFNMPHSLNFESAVKAADEVMRNKNPKLKRISNLLVSGRIRPYFYLCYYYLRWVDDFVDDNKNSIESKKIFVEHQLNLICSLMEGKSPHLNCAEEYFLFYLIEYLRSLQKSNLINLIVVMLNTIRQDVHRLEKDGIFTEAEMQKYFEDQAKSGFGIVNFFLMPKEHYKYDDKFTCVLTFIFISFAKDLFNDLKLGYVNISREDINKFKLDVNNLLNDSKLKDWYKDVVISWKESLKKDVSVIKELPIKLKLYWFWLYPYCLHKINRIKIYDYTPINLKQKVLINEVILYLTAGLNTIKAFYKVFITP